MGTKAIAEELVNVLSGLSVSAQIGLPKGVGPRLYGFVTMGSQQLVRKTTGTAQRRRRFFVLLVYRVDGDEDAAEDVLMDLVDSFVGALLADLTLNGTCRSLEVDTGLADEPDYQLRAGKEFREYPVLVEALGLGEGFETNP